MDRGPIRPDVLKNGVGWYEADVARFHLVVPSSHNQFALVSVQMDAPKAVQAVRVRSLAVPPHTDRKHHRGQPHGQRPNKRHEVNIDHHRTGRNIDGRKKMINCGLALPLSRVLLRH